MGFYFGTEFGKLHDLFAVKFLAVEEFGWDRDFARAAALTLSAATLSRREREFPIISLAPLGRGVG